jgi:hypothetical protein
MESMDNVRERIEALEQQMKVMGAHTRTVERRLRWWRGIACGIGLLGLVSLPLPGGMAKEDDRARETLERRVQMLEAKLAAVTVDPSNAEIVITRANLRIVNGLGTTETTNGLGNLIVGYNELRKDPTLPPNLRTGSHNVVVGKELNFSSFGGLVVGLINEISGTFASVSGGQQNTATGRFASISGGLFNRASGAFASVSGGNDNTASGFTSSVSGGIGNTASGSFASSVCGGRINVASGEDAAVSGGFQNTASGFGSSVSGGEHNTAQGDFSSVSGGSNRSAPGTDNWIAGSLFADN